MTATGTCSACGRHAYASDATADVHFPRHSCAKQRQRFKPPAAAGTTGRRRAAPRLRAPRPAHRHGTRTAYVRTDAVAAAAWTSTPPPAATPPRANLQAAGGPIDAAPVREHITYLREHHLGMTQIAKLAHTSVSHIRQLVGTTADGRPTTLRVRPSTPPASSRSSPARPLSLRNARVDGTGTRRRLQALVAIGFPLPFLAGQLGRTHANLARTLRRASVCSTAHQVQRALYGRLWDTTPPHATKAQRAASAHARAHAQRHRWRPQLAGTTSTPTRGRPGPGPDPDTAAAAAEDIGGIAVDRAVAGDGVRLDDLTPAEQAEAVRRLTKRGKSIREIADQLATTTRTVSRRRTAFSAA
jgi:hypothetical protein